MTFTIGFWIIPVILTIICLGCMARSNQGSDYFGMGALVSILWLIPIGFIWAIYFAIMYFVS